MNIVDFLVMQKIDNETGKPGMCVYICVRKIKISRVVDI